MKKTSSLLSLLLCLASLSYSQTVTIGTQVWATKNLNVSTFRNGDPIPHAKTAEEWKKAGENRQPAWCYYDNDTVNGKKYGKLYNGYAVRDPRGLAPVGYHIANDSEIERLYYGIFEKLLGADWQTVLEKNMGIGADVAKQLRSSSGWKNNGNGTNSTGFNALPGGSRDPNGTFSHVGYYGYWWMLFENAEYNEEGFTKVYYLDYISGSLHRARRRSNKNGFSVRCLKD